MPPSSPTERAGSFVVVVGPDGVGKSTVAGAICAAVQPSRYFHFRPPLRAGLMDRPASAPPPPKPPPVPRPGPIRIAAGWLRLARSLVLFWIAYLLHIKPAVRRGALVVGDRWGYGYLVQPQTLRFYGPRWLARAGVRLLPRPDLVAVLVAPTSVIRDRKPELTREQIEAELAAWPGIPHPRVSEVDAGVPPQRAAEAILAALPPVAKSPSSPAPEAG